MEEFVEILIIRIAYLTIDYRDDELLQMSGAIDLFLQDASSGRLLLEDCTERFGLGLISPIAIAANFWRLHFSGKIYTYGEFKSSEDPINPVNADNKCMLCLAQLGPSE